MENLVPILVPLACFAMIFGIVYVIVTARNRERLALIEKGADPKLFESVKKSSTGGILKWALLLVGIGLGIFLATLLVEAGMNEPASYFAMICLFGGAGLLLAYKIEQKSNPEKNRE
jgi:archaellum biogenesis protein FlaJ (TadC family)